MTKKWAIILAAIALVVIAIFVAILFSQNQAIQTFQGLYGQAVSTQKAQSAQNADQLATQQAALATARAESAALQSTLTAKSTAFDTLQTASDQFKITATADLAAAKKENVNLLTNAHDLQDQADKFKNLYTTALTDLNNARKNSKCDITTSVKFDYTTNSTLSESLKTFVGDISDKPTSADWTVIWSNTRDAIHKVHGKYLSVFIVIYKDENLNHPDNLLFWVDRGCWLDRP